MILPTLGGLARSYIPASEMPEYSNAQRERHRISTEASACAPVREMGGPSSKCFRIALKRAVGVCRFYLGIYLLGRPLG